MSVQNPDKQKSRELKAKHRHMKKLTNKIGQFYEYQFNLKEKIAKSNFFKLNFAIFIIEAVY